MVTEKEIKEKRKQCIKKEHNPFKLLILLGAIRYNVVYNGCTWSKIYKVRAWHPLTWVFLIYGIISGLFLSIFEACKSIKDEFKEKRYYV